MGLDLLPLARPRPGQENAFAKTWQAFYEATGEYASTAPRRSLWQRLTGQGRMVQESEQLADALRAMSDEAYTLIGAPVVGRDTEADDWLEGRIAQGLYGDQDPETIRQQMRGYHAMELLPECDGFPVYSNHFLPGAPIDRLSFRGQFLTTCEDVLQRDEIARAWSPMLAADLAIYAGDLAQAAGKAAETHGHQDLLGQREAPEVPDGDIQSQIHITDSLARWCGYWSERGHGLSPDW